MNIGLILIAFGMAVDVLSLALNLKRLFYGGASGLPVYALLFYIVGTLFLTPEYTWGYRAVILIILVLLHICSQYLIPLVIGHLASRFFVVNNSKGAGVFDDKEA